MNNISERELSYIAGFLDGDGCINAQIIRRKGYKLGFQIRVSITFFQKTNRHWFLLWLQKKLKYGTLRKRPDGISELAIIGNKNVMVVLESLFPFLIIKKKQASLLLTIIKRLSQSQNPQDFLNLCGLVDKFLFLNDSKKRSVTTTVVRNEYIGLNLLPVETEDLESEI